MGATTMVSPVWTPIGSKFSMLQMVMQLSAPSRITSYSISFQPSEVPLDQHLRDRAGGQAAAATAAKFAPSWTRCRRRCRRACRRAGSMSGRPICSASCYAFLERVAIALSGTGSPSLDEHVLEELAVLGVLDGCQRRAEQAHVVLLEDARLRAVPPPG